MRAVRSELPTNWRCATADDAVALANQDRRRQQNRKRQSGIDITPTEYARRLQEQGGVCAICKLPPGEKQLAVDHDHETGEIRGLLCNDCNLGLGFFRDDPDLLRHAGAYLA
jgi:hypothetical protein